MVYMGSKRRLAYEINSILHLGKSILNTDTYYEPFIGGCNIIKGVDFKNRYGSDINKELIAFINKLRTDGIKNIPERITRDEWYYVKNNRDKVEDWYYFYCMNFWSFRMHHGQGYNQWRFDRETDMIGKIQREIDSLTGFNIKQSDYRDIDIQNNSVVYLDPPYRNTSDYKTDFNHKDFYDWAIKTAQNNFVLISEYFMPKQFIEIAHYELRNISNNSTATECLYLVKGGLGVDKVFEEMNAEIEI